MRIRHARRTLDCPRKFSKSESSSHTPEECRTYENGISVTRATLVGFEAVKRGRWRGSDAPGDRLPQPHREDHIFHDG